MAKFHGIVGYAETSETSPGVWSEVITDRTYTGDVVRNTKKWQSGENLSDNLTVNNELSIIADPFVYENLHNIRYVQWMGVKWKVLNVDINRPRVRLTIGGVYNG